MDELSDVREPMSHNSVPAESGNSTLIKSSDFSATNASRIRFDVLKWLGERRDGFLVGGAILYGLGYLVWSYNAWRNHLGQLPALEFQYLASGIIPALILLLAAAGAGFVLQVHETLFRFFQRHPILRFVPLFALNVFPLAVYVASYAAKKGWVSRGLPQQQVAQYSTPLIIIALYFALFTGTEVKWSMGGYQLNLFAIYRFLVPIAFGWYSIALYLDLYSRLPQELGGPHPRCAYVDLVRDDTAPSTLAALASPNRTDAGEGKVIRSNRLDVYFSSNDYLLVRAHQSSEAPPDGTSAKDQPSKGPPDATSAKDQPLYELRKEVIRAVQWCR
jgi:hypothetical protein